MGFLFCSNVPKTRLTVVILKSGCSIFESNFCKMKNVFPIVVFIFSSSFAWSQNPVFKWAKSFGGLKQEQVYSIATDASGNVYTTGTYSGTVDFDPGPGTYTSTPVNQTDVFISKLDSLGNFVWARCIGGTGSDFSNSIAVDNAGNVYITGSYVGLVDFDSSTGTYTVASNGSTDIFILKLDASGNFIWVKSFGGQYSDSGISIGIDPSGNVITAGYFNGLVDFDPGPNNHLLSSSSGYHATIILNLDTNGNFIWAVSSGGGESEVTSMDIDLKGNIYATGNFKGTTNFGPFNLASGIFEDLFIIKINQAGSCVWAKKVGNSSKADFPGMIGVDGLGNVYYSGSFSQTVDFDPGIGTYLLTSVSAGNAFISKLDSVGNFGWAKIVFGGNMDIDLSGNIYLTELFDNTVDFDPDSTIYNLTAYGYYDLFILKLTASGSFVWAVNMGGTPAASTGWGQAIKADENGNIYTAGDLYSTVDFDPGTGIASLTSNGSYDVFVQKMRSVQAVGVVEISDDNNLKIYPNPTNGSITIGSKNELQKIEVVSITGQILLTEIPTNASHTLHLGSFANGIYFVNMYQNDRIVKREKIVLNK